MKDSEMEKEKELKDKEIRGGGKERYREGQGKRVKRIKKEEVRKRKDSERGQEKE